MELAFFGSPVARGVLLLLGILVAIISVLIATTSVLTARSIARKKQVADLLFSCRNDQLLAKGLKTIRDASTSPNTNLASFAGFTTSDDETALSLRYVLNHYEYISICIQSEIYDEEMLRKAMRRTVIRSYQHSKGYIDAMRELHQTKTLYQEFQWLAERWKVKEIDVKFPNGA